MGSPPDSLRTLVDRFDATAIDAPAGRARIRLEVTDGEQWDVLLDGGRRIVPAARGAPDALLIADRDRTQDVKKIVERLKASGSDKASLHLTVARPWGTYTVLQDAARFKIKRLEVKPGASLSLQMHHHRNEHWVVVSGTAQVVNGEATLTLQSNESTYIPAGNKHRLANPGKESLVIIEVQVGDYVGEDDIVRFEDRYGRVERTPAASR